MRVDTDDGALGQPHKFQAKRQINGVESERSSLSFDTYGRIVCARNRVPTNQLVRVEPEY